jgi:hypothetical protein
MRPGKLMGLFLVPALLACAGCGKDAKTVKVQGVVTLDGKPLEGATVTFIPLEGGSGRMASGRTDSDGTFQLTTFRTYDGALPGEYKVTVELPQPDNYWEGKGDPDKMDLKDKAEYYSQRSPQGKAKAAARAKKAKPSPVPAVYGDAKRTPLKEIVPAEGTVQLELRSTAK